MVATIKFSQMTSGGDLANNEATPGLLNIMGVSTNVLFNNPWTFLPPGSTAAQPPPSPAINGRLRFNTDTLIYEYYDTNSGTWVQLSGSGTGTVNPGFAHAVAFYAANGTAVSPTNTANLSVLVTDNTGFPSFKNTLPTGLTIPSATITSSTAALTSGQIVATPANPTDIVNKAYVDAAVGGDVTSITGTTNQIIASSPTGAVTLSTPQDIAHGSTPTFAGLTLTSIPLAVGSGGLGISTTPTNGQIPIGNGTNYTANTLSAGPGISIVNGSGTVTISSITSGMTWSTVTTSQAAVVDNGYVSNSAGALTFTLPATANVGDIIAVEGLGAGGWILTANTGQTIKIGSGTTSSAGSLTSANASDNVYVTCIVANTTWRVRTTNSIGLIIS